MPTLHWIGKEKVQKHHNDVPYRVLEKQYTYGEYGNDAPRIVSQDNMIIHGDNLEALKALLPEYQGKVDCIYIDPPYNTGNEGWVYNDNVNDPHIRKWLGAVVGKEAEDLTRHDKWLCMMYPRLVLLQKLLSPTGAIFISIDDNEQANLKLICDEIFGAGNFVMCITWRRSDNQANIGKIAKVAEYVYLYCRDKTQCQLGKLPLTNKAKSAYTYSDAKGLFRRSILLDKTRGRKFYPKVTKLGNTLNGPWMVTEEEFDRMDANGEIYWTTDGDGQPYGKIYLSNSKGQIPNNFWGIEFGTNQRASIELENIFGKRIFDFPKPTSLVENILSIGSTNPNALILDSFAGSGTTAQAVLNLNKQDGGHRRFILVEMCDYAETITAERVRRVIDGYGEGSKAVEGTGGSFAFYELGDTIYDPQTGLLNDNADTEQIRRYIWYSETNTPYHSPKVCGDDAGRVVSMHHPYLLGRKDGTNYYFYYKRGEETVLDRAFLNTFTPADQAEQYIIYADCCRLSREFMQTHHITFKQIPRDIKKV